MVTQAYNPLDDLFLDNQDNIQGLIGYLSGYGENEDRQKQLQAQGRASSTIAADLYLLDVEIYKSNYPTGITQHLMQFYINTQRRVTSGPWYEFIQSLDKLGFTQVRLSTLKNKYMNVRLEMRPARAQVDGQWADTEQPYWVVKAIGDTKDEVRLPDDTTWGGTLTTATKTESPLGGLSAQAGAAPAVATAPAVAAPTPATAAPPVQAVAVNGDDLILTLANGRNLVEFQQAVFSSPEASTSGLSDRVLNEGGGVGVLAPYVADGRLVKDETDRYRKA